MKTILLILCLAATFVYGQNVVLLTSAEYQQLKQTGMINPSLHYSLTDFSASSGIKYNGSSQKNAVCDCFVPLDSTFTLAMLPNDDGSSALINLPFDFNFYGDLYNSLYINNNGNISFGSPYMTWTSFSFPDSTYNMIAPFWADVDTRGGMDSLGNYLGNGGAVWYKVTPTALIVNWNQVGYFNMHTDLVSTFQLIISNGADSLVSAGGNVSFCYDDMQWTTGDASNGFYGFGGYPATVGVNIGNGTDYFQVGQFVQPGTDFDGPTNNLDGVDFLDGQEVYFNIAGASTTNTPPLLISSAICDTIDVITGDTLKSANSSNVLVGLMTPELGQDITIGFTSDAPQSAFSYSLSLINDGYYELNTTFNGTGVSPGFYHVTLTATDNGIPAGTASMSLVYEVTYDASAALSEQSQQAIELFPNPTSDIVTVMLGESEGNFELTLQDLTGKLLIQRCIQGQSQIDLGIYSEGIYLVSLHKDGKLYAVERLSKE